MSQSSESPAESPSQSSTGAHLSSRILIRRLIRDNVRPYFGRIGIAMIFMAIVGGATAFSALLMKNIVDDVFIAKDEAMLWLVGGAILITFIAKGVANYIQATLMSHVGLRVIADCQNRLYAHLAHMDLAFFHNTPTGTLLSRFTIDISAMRAVVSSVLTSLGKDLISLIGLVAVMFYRDWKLAAISFLIFIVAVYPIIRLGRRTRKVTANTQQETGLLTTLLEQTIQGIRVVKSYGMEAYEKGRVAVIIDRIYQLSFKAARVRALSSPIMESLGGIAIAFVVIYGGYRTIEGETTPGSFFSFITAFLLAYEPMKRLANLNITMQEGLAGAQRYFSVIDIESDIREKENASDLAVTQGAIELENVSFAYTPGHGTLSDVSLKVPAGQSVALVGPSGAGKSTILNLIPRFYDIDKGHVKIDGTDVRDATLASLHKHIALVSQEITLFDDTIRANIAYGRAGASEDDIIEAARNAAAHDYITKLPNGYDTVVGEQGVKLSGGQRQRLAIARAMLKNAPILLLDEATSALDSESERQVQTALHGLMKGRTSLVIAHRLSTVMDADIIYVIDKGCIVEHGKHDALLEQDGIYARLYAMQFFESE